MGDKKKLETKKLTSALLKNGTGYTQKHTVTSGTIST